MSLLEISLKIMMRFNAKSSSLLLLVSLRRRGRFRRKGKNKKKYFKKVMKNNKTIKIKRKIYKLNPIIKMVKSKIIKAPKRKRKNNRKNSHINQLNNQKNL